MQPAKTSGFNADETYLIYFIYAVIVADHSFTDMLITKPNCARLIWVWFAAPLGNFLYDFFGTARQVGKPET